MGKQISRYEHVLGANHTQYDRAMSRSSKETKRLSDSQRSMTASIALIDGPLGGVASRVSNFNTLITKGGVALGGFALGVSALGFASVKATRQLADFEVAQQKITNILNVAGFAAGRTAQQIEELAQAEGFRTLADVKDIRSAAAALTSYGTIVGDVFDRTIGLGNDAAQVFGGDVTSNVQLLAKALDDPNKGLERLERKFGKLDEKIRDNIKSLAEQGNLYAAQDLLLQQLEKRIGGAGDGQGISFSLDSLGQSFDNAFVAFGKWTGISDAVVSASNAMQESFQGFADDVDPSFKVRVAAVAELKEEIAAYEAEISQLSGDTGNLRSIQIVSALRDRLKVARQELEINEKIVDAEQAKRKEVEAQAKAKRDQAIAAQSAREEEEAMLSLYAKVDELTEEYDKKREKRLEKEARERERAEEKRLRTIRSQEAEILGIRIASLDPIDRVNAEHQRTIDRLLAIKEISPSLAGQVDNVIPLANARNEQDQKDIFKRQLSQELSQGPNIDVDADSTNATAQLEAAYNARKTIIEGFAAEETLAAEAKKDALTALDEEYAENSAAIQEMKWEAATGIAMGALGDLSSLMNSESRKAFEIGKVAAIAQTVISTYQGAQHAFTGMVEAIPGPAGFAAGVAAAGAAIAAGFVRVQAINARSFGDKSAPSAGASGTNNISSSATPSSGETVDQGRGVEVVLNGNYNGDPVLLANAIKEVIDDSDLIFIDPNSRNGQELRTA